MIIKLKEEIINFNLKLIKNFIEKNKNKKICINNITEQIFYCIQKNCYFLIYYYLLILDLFFYNIFKNHTYLSLSKVKGFLNNNIEKYIKDIFGCHSSKKVNTAICKLITIYTILLYKDKISNPIKHLKKYSIEINMLRSRIDILTNEIIKID